MYMYNIYIMYVYASGTSFCVAEGDTFYIDICMYYVCVYVYTGTLSCCGAGIIKLLFRLPKIITAT